MFASLRILAVLSLIGLASCKPSPADRVKAKALAKSAYSTLENRPFEMDSVNVAIRQLATASTLSPDESWVHIGLGQLALTRGHDAGSWYKMKRYDPAAVEVARTEAAKALAADSAEPQAWCFSALLHILDKRWDLVQSEVNRAYLLDTSAFKPYHLRAVTYRLLKQYDKSRQFYKLADCHAVEIEQKKQVLQGLSEVAKGLGDYAEQLRLLMQVVENDPTNGWAIGLVAEWYMAQKRYPEAVQWWEKTVAIAPFPRAVDQLAKAREAVKTGVAIAPDE